MIPPSKLKSFYENIVIASTSITRTLFCMVFLPQDITFCSVLFIFFYTSFLADAFHVVLFHYPNSTLDALMFPVGISWQLADSIHSP
jgi:hypothetical protein